ncbi:MAG: metal-sulfur cluster assembly factor [Deltaproteobacteria bacterium]|nr:metal-sulfur cluster assembly factor [Deltaproteobacteria bacterium]MBN2670948.1 metal-sulfur cluster assembly factor [Deltaproteobacteria bacterium]
MEEQIMETLKQVYDPELDISVVDLGLIRKIDISAEGDVKIDMTLTSPACPMAPQLIEAVKHMAGKAEGVQNVDVHMVFRPPWNANTDPTDSGKFQLSML